MHHPPPILPGVGRPHLGQGSRPGGKSGKTAEREVKTSLPRVGDRPQISQATPLLTVYPAIADLRSKEWEWVGSRTRLPSNRAQMDASPIETRHGASASPLGRHRRLDSHRESPHGISGQPGHLSSSPGPRAEATGPGGPGRAGRAGRAGPRRASAQIASASQQRELHFYVPCVKSGQAVAEISKSESATPVSKGPAGGWDICPATPERYASAHARKRPTPIVSPSLRMAARLPRAKVGPSPGRRQCARDGPATRDQRSSPGSRPDGSDAARRPRVKAWPDPPASHHAERNSRRHA
jgi:hypothetical protein